MSEQQMSSPPAWMPASVGRAYTRGTATDDDLISGRAWEAMLDALRRAAVALKDSSDQPVERGAAYRHLLVLIATGIDEALRRGDPYEPHIRPGSTDAVLKWGMDCPDALYVGSPIRGDAVYRITGTRGTVRYLGFQVMAGIATTANVVAEDLSVNGDGSFELVLSAEKRAGNWMPLAPEATQLVVREFFYDWENEVPADLNIELIAGGRPPREAGTLSAAGVARQIVALGEFVEASVTFWSGIDEQLRGRGVNRFQEPDARTDLGGAAENVTVWGSWEVGDDEALVVEVTPPEAIYWSIALGNRLWESIDYADHQSSLNGHQAVIDDDGVFRTVIAQRDPGVANWLDPAGHTSGPVIMRYVRAAGFPVPEARLVKMEGLDRVLPPGTARVDPNARRRVVAGRRAGVRRRFSR